MQISLVLAFTFHLEIEHGKESLHLDIILNVPKNHELKPKNETIFSYKHQTKQP